MWLLMRSPELTGKRWHLNAVFTPYDLNTAREDRRPDRACIDISRLVRIRRRLVPSWCG